MLRHRSSNLTLNMFVFGSPSKTQLKYNDYTGKTSLHFVILNFIADVL